MLSGTLCFLLTAVGLVIAGLHGWHRRWRTAVRWAAAALVPAGLYLTDLIPVGSAIGRALGNWATKLVLDLGVWMGIGLLGLAALLLAATGVGRKPDRDKGDDSGSGRRKGAAKPASPAAGAGDARPSVGSARPGKSAAEELGDFSDIEEILRKRGI
ncbi:hypothetical protein [Kitasatospora acidiphila]|uniref:hypothetical protein n=1 Tax=Kitasatospora acidiphila TaxID=2567942 RepID=UPI003C733AC6